MYLNTRNPIYTLLLLLFIYKYSDKYVLFNRRINNINNSFIALALTKLFRLEDEECVSIIDSSLLNVIVWVGTSYKRYTTFIVTIVPLCIIDRQRLIL